MKLVLQGVIPHHEDLPLFLCKSNCHRPSPNCNVDSIFGYLSFMKHLKSVIRVKGLNKIFKLQGCQLLQPS